MICRGRSISSAVKTRRSATLSAPPDTATTTARSFQSKDCQWSVIRVSGGTRWGVQGSGFRVVKCFSGLQFLGPLVIST